MVQCAAFDLDATIKAATRVWRGVVERPWMPATWFSATVASAESGSADAAATGTGDWGTGRPKPRLTSIARRQK